jgi:hypothetical protein
VQQRAWVENLAAFGIPQETIVQLIRRPQRPATSGGDTALRHFRKELDLGLLKANANTAQKLYQKAPERTHDPQADDVSPYPDLAPFGNHGLEQFMEALKHLGMQIVVKPIDV